MSNSIEPNDALEYLSKNYPDAHVNNNKYIIANNDVPVNGRFRFMSMKQSVFKNIEYRDSLFENVALTGSSFDNVKFVNTKLIGNSFANCNFYSTEINGTRAAFSANNFSQSNFEQCTFSGAKFFRSGVLNTLFHRCLFKNICLRGSTFEGAQFIDCIFTDCDFGNVNIDYTLFSKNTYRGITFPFYQIAYIIGAADFICDPMQRVNAKAGERIISLSEYSEQADKLIIYYLDKGEYFPACNLCIAQKKYEKAKEYLLSGVDKAIENKNFRMISNFCRLAKYHEIADEHVKHKILKMMDSFIQSDNVPESQLNYYLIYMGNIKSLLNEGAPDTVTLNYTVRTNTCKKNKDGVRYVNDMVSHLNNELSSWEDVRGFDVSITNHSPFEIVVGVVTILSAAATIAGFIMNLITNMKSDVPVRRRRGVKLEQVDSETHEKYMDERISRATEELLRMKDKYSGKQLDKYIVEVTQSLKTDLEELYSKDIMIFKIKNKDSR